MTKFKPQILLSSDESFIHRLPSFIKNLMAFNREHLDIYILTNFAIEQSPTQALFAEFVDHPQVKVHFHYVTPERRLACENVDYSNDSRSNAMSLRLYATDLNLSGRVLYLDADILVTAPFDELFDDEQVDLQGKTLGVVADYYIMNKNLVSAGNAVKQKLSNKARDLTYDQNNPYFNSGFLLIDMDKLRASDLWLKHVAELQNYKAFPDQDLLNVIHYGDIVRLNSKYNYLAYHLINTRYYYYHDHWDQVLATKVQAGQANPDTYAKVIPTFLHFAGRQKQWNSSAQEFVDAYQMFNQPLTQVLGKSVGAYEQYFAALFKAYGYYPVLNDYTPLITDYYEPSRQVIHRLRQQRKQKWGYNPLYLNTKMFATGGVRVLLRNALTTSGREKFNQKIYPVASKQFQQFLRQEQTAN
ncbi:glycosyltransferase [Psittacicella hinzii]|uniref:General stress protein A n=1 Tax=Psittacicella hinzii TaxID=2028575 RepID=A0A3A1YMQ5_9GAMM|nr:glycosyltransferase [Psittacicella hinzii]RIY38955.1 hypothetical protein CKF58_03105 [Psittacicella hinzii]